jgi:SAM-dependent methyltransferase
MTQGLAPNDPGPVMSSLRLVPARCPLCGRDEGEPVAVGSDFEHHTSPDSFLLLACPACGVLYLNPRPVAAEWDRLYPPEYFAASTRASHQHTAADVRRLLRSCGPLPMGARVLEVAYGPTSYLQKVRQAAPREWTLEAVTPHEPVARAARDAGFVAHHGRPDMLADDGTGYDLVLLLHALEHCDAPLEELRSIRRRLRPAGRVLVTTPNPASASWRMFRGRHWAGYDFPRHRCLWGPAQLERLAAQAGFTVERLATRGDRRIWSRSAERFANDWAVPVWLAGTVKGGFALVGGCETLAAQAARGTTWASQLVAILRGPGEVGT